MNLLHCRICLTLCIALVLVSGCADTSFGTLKPTDFGTSPEEVKALDYYKQKYGEPGQPGEPRFLEPTLTTALDTRNLPVDSISSLSADSPKVYFWVFYDRFAKGDPMTITWTYLDNNKAVLTETKAAGGVYGRVFAEFVRPAGNWPTGQAPDYDYRERGVRFEDLRCHWRADRDRCPAVHGERCFCRNCRCCSIRCLRVSGCRNDPERRLSRFAGTTAPPPVACSVRPEPCLRRLGRHMVP